MILRVEEFGQRLVAHPVRAALFLDAGDADVDATHIDEAGTAQPAFQRRHRRQEPDVAHLRVTIFGNQRGVFVALDHQSFQYQFATPDQAILQVQQMVDGRATVIEHAHGKHRVEAFEFRRELFQRHRQMPGRQLVEVALHGVELAEEQPVRIDAHHRVGAGAEHPPHVVAVAAADVEDALAGEIQMRRHALPFPVRTPFGIHVHAEDVERPLAPRRQAEQRIMGGGARRLVAIAFQAEGFAQLDGNGLDIRQRVDRALPARQVAVANGELGFQLLLQAIGPGGQRGAGQAPGEGCQVEVHGRAISEAKFRHWNQGTTLEKPASSSRWRWVSRLSGFITFSMALRFWAISSSL